MNFIQFLFTTAKIFNNQIGKWLVFNSIIMKIQNYTVFAFSNDIQINFTQFIQFLKHLFYM